MRDQFHHMTLGNILYRRPMLAGVDAAMQLARPGIERHHDIGILKVE